MKGLLSICGALAAGEYLASFGPHFAETWPFVAGLLAFVLLFGYGLKVRGWPLVFFFLLGVGLFLHASTDEVRLYREQPWMRAWRGGRRPLATSVPSALRAARADFSRRMSVGLSGGRAETDLARAILLGERRRLSPEMKETFVASGALHVFAISGLHVMAIAELIAYLLALLFVPRRLAGLVSVPILWCYVLLVGWSPSAVRAAAMATVQLLAPVFWRRPNGLRAWALAFLVIHLLSPRMIVNVGNVLSFAVMLAIVLVGDAVRDWPKARQTLAVTVAAWAVGVPISAHVFGRVTPGGMLANLVLILTARLTVVTGALGVLASYISSTLAAHVNNLAALLVRSMTGVAELVSRLPGSNLEVPRWTVLECAAWYALAVLAAVLVRRIRARRLFG